MKFRKAIPPAAQTVVFGTASCWPLVTCRNLYLSAIVIKLEAPMFVLHRINRA
jgi:hypothetical protein